VYMYMYVCEPVFSTCHTKDTYIIYPNGSGKADQTIFLFKEIKQGGACVFY